MTQELSLVLHSVSDRMAYADAEEEDNDREALPPIELPLIHSFLYSLLQILPEAILKMIVMTKTLKILVPRERA